MKDSQLNPYEHSEIKVKLLKTYLEMYLNILSLSKFVKKVSVFDLFCGEGVYENKKLGSPVIILKLLSELSEKFKSQIEFECFFNDKEVEKIKKLEVEVEKLIIKRELINNTVFSNKNYEDLKSELYVGNKNKEFKRFIFIDPYGYKDISIKDIEKYLSDKNTEVLLFLPTHFMYRFEKKGTPPKLHEFLNEAVPNLDSLNSSTGVEFIHKIRDGLGVKLKNKYFVDSFIISRDKNEFFALFFFTSHLYGFEKFLEAKWNIDNEQGRGWSPTASIDLFSQLEEKANIDDFEEKLKRFLVQNRSNIEIHKFTIENRHLIKHSNQLLKKWQNNNELIVNFAAGENSQKGSFHISWEKAKTKIPSTYIKLK